MPEQWLHPLLGGRWSPSAFDPGHIVSDDDVATMLEAARWAPSAGNSQPWSFVAAIRGSDEHELVLRTLRQSALPWAADASVLFVNIYRRYVDDTDWEYSEFGAYDTGQAVAHLTVQARAIGLAARQFRAFDKARLTRALRILPEFEILTMTAVGAPAGADTRSSRQRAPVDEIISRARDSVLPPTDEFG